ncbi:TPA: hypothetical protein N0F65_006084 [Lagenidium giganteum]|uniref:Uncharacterized protein n=1 Tax=Lagenidium giganteum TaxID=4803 RepID=A0AAV2YPA0_9STRA|nr:TPA: hypothetical protein N0F65_006084 [Lagenidium giganteum]
MVLLSCAAADCVKTFDLTTEELRLHHSIGALNAEVTCVRYNHNGKILATSGVDGGICLNVASSGELLSRFFYPAKNLTERRVNSVHFSSGSRFLVSGSHDGCVRIWDLKTQEVKQAYSVSASPVTAVTFSGFKDEHVVAGSECGALSIYDVRTSENAGFLTVDPRFGVSKVMAIQASPHPAAPHAVGATYADGSVRLWDLNAGQLAAEFVQQHEAAATALAISPVSKVLLATGGLDRRVLFYDTLQRKELRCIESDHPVTALSLCADGKTLAVGQSNGDIVIYDLRGSISPMFCATVHDTAMINALQFASPDTTTMNTTGATAGQPPGNNEQLSPPKAEYVHDLAMRKLQSFHIGAPPPVPVVATSQDGNALSPSKDAHMTSPSELCVWMIRSHVLN